MLDLLEQRTDSCVTDGALYSVSWELYSDRVVFGINGNVTTDQFNFTSLLVLNYTVRLYLGADSITQGRLYSDNLYTAVELG